MWGRAAHKTTFNAWCEEWHNEQYETVFCLTACCHSKVGKHDDRRKHYCYYAKSMLWLQTSINICRQPHRAYQMPSSTVSDCTAHYFRGSFGSSCTLFYTSQLRGTRQKLRFTLLVSVASYGGATLTQQICEIHNKELHHFPVFRQTITILWPLHWI